MLFKDIAQSQGHVVLKRLEFAINFDVVFVGFGRFQAVQFDKLIGNFVDGNFFALVLALAGLLRKLRLRPLSGSQLRC